MAAYLYFASKTWVRPGEEGLHSMTGEPIVWAITAVPFLLASTVVNLVWLAVLFYYMLARRRGPWSDLIVFSAVLCAWMVALVLDFSRHPLA